jgi:hypothetical protein
MHLRGACGIVLLAGFSITGCGDNVEPEPARDPDTQITRFFSVHATGDPGLADQDIAPGDTIADSSRVTFEWTAEGDFAGFFWRFERLLLASDSALASQPETREASAQWLTSDPGEYAGLEGFLLIVGAIDTDGVPEAAPDTVPFFVNFPPSVTITRPESSPVSAPGGRLVVSWEGADRDGPASALAFDVELSRTGGTSISRVVQAGQPDSTLFEEVPEGSYRIRVTPLDRRGLGKAGAADSIDVDVTVDGG